MDNMLGGGTTSVLVLRKLKKSKAELHVTFILKESTIQWQQHCDVMLCSTWPQWGQHQCSEGDTWLDRLT